MDDTNDLRSSDRLHLIFSFRSVMQVLANIVDMRIDLKIEMSRIQQKITKIEESLEELLKRSSSHEVAGVPALPGPPAECGPSDAVVRVAASLPRPEHPVEKPQERSTDEASEDQCHEPSVATETITVPLPPPSDVVPSGTSAEP